MKSTNDPQIQEPPPQNFFGIPLHNKRVAYQFCFIFILFLIVPFSVFFGLRQSFGEIWAGISAIISIQFIITIYVIMSVKDPENFPKADQARKQMDQRKLKVKQDQLEPEPITSNEQYSQKKQAQSCQDKLKQS